MAYNPTTKPVESSMQKLGFKVSTTPEGKKGWVRTLGLTLFTVTDNEGDRPTYTGYNLRLNVYLTNMGPPEKIMHLSYSNLDALMQSVVLSEGFKP